MATKAVFEWNKSRGLEELIRVIANLRAEGNQLEQLLNNILVQVSELVGSSSSMIAPRGKDGKLDKMLATGRLASEGSPLNSERYYMVKLFLEQAGQAIENVTLQEKLMQKEKLSAVEAVHRLDLPAKRVLVKNWGDESVVHFEVSDNGSGIPEEIRADLFKPFTTKGKTGGTGLGLSIVKNFVEAHGGDIEVESSDQGTTFRFQLDRNGRGDKAQD